MPLSRLAVAVLFKGQDKPHVPNAPRLFSIRQAPVCQTLVRQGWTDTCLPSRQCGTCLFLATLAQDQGENPVFPCPQQQPAAYRCIKGGRIAPDLDYQRGKIATSGSLPGAPDRIPETLRPDKNKSACIDTVLPQAIGKRQAAVETCCRIDDPEYPAIRPADLCRTFLPVRTHQQRQDKPRRSADVTALGAAHLVKPVPHKTA